MKSRMHKYKTIEELKEDSSPWSFSRVFFKAKKTHFLELKFKRPKFTDVIYYSVTPVDNDKNPIAWKAAEIRLTDAALNKSYFFKCKHCEKIKYEYKRKDKTKPEVKPKLSDSTNTAMLLCELYKDTEAAI